MDTGESLISQSKAVLELRMDQWTMKMLKEKTYKDISQKIRTRKILKEKHPPKMSMPFAIIILRKRQVASDSRGSRGDRVPQIPT